MNVRLDDKVALVTGASRGIGRGIALEVAAAGAEAGEVDYLIIATCTPDTA